MKAKTKRPKAIWTTAYPAQAKALRPENSKAGGIKARSQPEAVRMKIYKAIAELYLMAHPFCECCRVIFKQQARENTCEIHHSHGRVGLLLFDVRWWKSACRPCHNWIGSHPKESRELGLLAKEGDWNKQSQ